MPEETTGRITDPKKLRALAHPLRWKLIELIGIAGSATATRCAEATGESVASCSYHLNMLAKYGYIEEVTGSGRQKPWRLTSYDQSWSGEGMDTEGQLAAEALSEAFLEYEFGRLRSYERTRGLLPKPWREASGMSSSTTFLTADEMAAVKGELREIIGRYYDRLKDPAKRPEGSRPVRLFTSVTTDPASSERERDVPES